MDMTNLYLNRAKFVLTALGIWLPPANYTFAYSIYAAFIFLTQFSFLFFEIVYIAKVWGDLESSSEASYLFFTQACLCYKMTAFFFKHKTLEKLTSFMQENIFQPKTKTHERILEDQATRIKRICLFFLLMATTTCFLWALIPLFDAAGTLPFKIWMPLRMDVSPQYELSYFYQVAGIYISAFIFNAVDTVALSMIMFSCAQLHIIRDKVLNIKGRKAIKSTSLVLANKNEEEKNYAELSDCILHHQTIVRFISQVEDAYHMNIFFQVSGSVGIICITGLRISIVDPHSMQFSSMISYLIAMLMQLYTYCWCGHELTVTVDPHSMQFSSMISYLIAMLMQLYTYCWCGHELTVTSQELRDVLYMCPWYNEGSGFNRSLWIAMERMKRPIVFRTGRYIGLSLQTFVSILRSSYSYFAVLQQVRNKPS